MRKRGAAAKALAIAVDSDALANAVIIIKSKYYAKNVVDVKVSKLKLAEHPAELVSGGPIYPLQEDILIQVAACLDAGELKSGTFYISELRLRHLELDHPVGPALSRCFKKINDGLSRGLEALFGK